jgi:uncharacterized membrane protein
VQEKGLVMNAFGLIDALAFVATLGSALMAGLFFAFSIAVMKALGVLPPTQGIAAMQSINRVVVNRGFLVVFFGTGAACIAVIVAALLDGGAADGAFATGSVFAIAGSFLYLAGTLLVTMVFNVPRNNALARADAASTEGAALWRRYLVEWTAWNHVRTATSLAATACLVVALIRRAAALG